MCELIVVLRHPQLHQPSTMPPFPGSAWGPQGLGEGAGHLQDALALLRLLHPAAGVGPGPRRPPLRGHRQRRPRRHRVPRCQRRRGVCRHRRRLNLVGHEEVSLFLQGGVEGDRAQRRCSGVWDVLVSFSECSGSHLHHCEVEVGSTHFHNPTPTHPSTGRMWSVGKKGELKCLKTWRGAHADRVTALVLRGETLYSASYDGSIKAWSAEGLDLLIPLEAAHCGQRINCMTAGPDGLLYSGGDDKVCLLVGLRGVGEDRVWMRRSSRGVGKQPNVESQARRLTAEGPPTLCQVLGQAVNRLLNQCLTHPTHTLEHTAPASLGPVAADARGCGAALPPPQRAQHRGRLQRAARLRGQERRAGHLEAGGAQ